MLICASSSRRTRVRPAAGAPSIPAAARAARFFERLAKPELQLAGGFLGEGDGHDLGHLGAPALDHPDDAVDELGGFAGPCGGFDDERVVEGVWR